jgi:anti-sigma regulatory factor (Ser/Thr protein kinase)
VVSSADNRMDSATASRYPGFHQTLAAIRADVSAWVTTNGFSTGTVERAELVVSELCSNAMEAGPGHPIDVSLARTVPGSATITVANTTLGTVPPPSGLWGPVSPLAPRGRGLAIVEALADRVLVDRSVPGRVTVVAHISDTRL